MHDKVSPGNLKKKKKDLFSNQVEREPWTLLSLYSVQTKYTQ